MLRFRQFVLEVAGGNAAGKLELVNTSPDKAREWAEKRAQGDEKLLEFVADVFDSGRYKAAQKAAKTGKTKRKDMPVIDTDDVRKLQYRLKKGSLDINRPFHEDTKRANPFPEGLSGREANEFLQRGLHDGSVTDDRVSVKLGKVRVSRLKPIQKQIYFDKTMGMLLNEGPENSEKFISTKSIFICSSDNYIIDGHHRWLSGLLNNPSMTVQCLIIDLPIDTLLPLAKAYGDAIGNKRNA